MCFGSFVQALPGRDLPEAFGDWNSVFRRFSRWSLKGVWWRIFEAMSDDPDFEYLIVDFHHRPSPPARCRGRKRGSEGQAIGRSRGGLSTRFYMVVRGLGCPVRFMLAAGQKGDAPQSCCFAGRLTCRGRHGRHSLRRRSFAPGHRCQRRTCSHPTTTRHGRSNIGSTSISMSSAISWSAASKTQAIPPRCNPLRKDSSKYLPSLSQPSSYGCDKCPRHP